MNFFKLSKNKDVKCKNLEGKEVDIEDDSVYIRK